MKAEQAAEKKRRQAIIDQDARRREAAATLGLDPTTATKPNAFAAPPTLRDYYARRVVDHLKAICSSASLQKVATPWAYLLYYLGDYPLDQLGAEVINTHAERMLKPGSARTFTVRKDGKPRKPKTDKLAGVTVNKHLQQLMATLRLAHEEGVIRSVPKVRFLPEDDTQEVVPPSDAEFEQVLRACDDFREAAPFLPEVVAFAAETGLRESELMNLCWSQIEMGTARLGALRIERRTKGRMRAGKPFRPKRGKFRVVPLTARACQILEFMRTKVPHGLGDKVFPNRGGCPYVRIEHADDVEGTGFFPEAVESVGLKGKVTFHMLRHLFAVRCLARGIPMPVVSDYLGHGSIELTVKLYGRFSDEAREKWKWIELLDEPVDAVARRRMLTVVEGAGNAR
jgi:integrase